MYKFITEEFELDLLCDEVRDCQTPIGLDLETTGLDWSTDKILLMQLSFDNQIYIVDVRKLGYDNLKKLCISLDASKSILIFHNGKFDLKFIIWRTGINFISIYDTQVAEVVLNAGVGKTFYSLKELAEKYCGMVMEKESRMDFVNFPDDKPYTESMLTYSALDVKVLQEIWSKQMWVFENTRQVDVIKLEGDLLPVVAQMEVTGIGIDKDAWLAVEKIAIDKRDSLGKQLKDMIIDFVVGLDVPNALELCKKISIPVKTKKLTKFLEDITDLENVKGWLYDNFNVKSSYQMKAVINLMGVDIPDTNEKTIAKFSDTPIIALLLSIREVNKQIDSYGKNVIDLVNPVTGKIHTEYSTVGTRTGRFSSKNPNMQQVPRKGGYRECFIPDEGYVFIGVDYSQQEYRLTGAVSREPIIIQAYKDKHDMHIATAAFFYNKSLAEVTKDERDWGKTRNFEIIYGTTEWGLSKSLKCSLDHAKEVLDTYWRGYPTLKKFKDAVEAKILELGFSSTLIGRRRNNPPKPMFYSSGELLKWKAQVLREGFNHIVQGTGADIIKIAMVRIHRENPFGDKLKLILQVHDEVVVMAHKSVMVEAGLFVKNIMEDVEQKFLKDTPAKVDGYDVFKERWSK